MKLPSSVSWASDAAELFSAPLFWPMPPRHRTPIQDHEDFPNEREELIMSKCAQFDKSSHLERFECMTVRANG